MALAQYFLLPADNKDYIIIKPKGRGRGGKTMTGKHKQQNNNLNKTIINIQLYLSFIP